ncbi:MAG: 50S ribosomal protein L25/general stress protein Ctc [Gammaproteobacteria bacterium]
MSQLELSAEKREPKGKGANRRLRRLGKVPAIVYGAGKEPQALQVDAFELTRHLSAEAFYSSVLALKTGQDKERVVVKEIQRHPYKQQILHLDLQRIDETEKITMRVPIHFINEDKCLGVKQQGGVISRVANDVEVLCLPKDLPEYIEVDLAALIIGETIHLGEINLPSGVEIAHLTHGGDPAQPVVSVHTPKGAQTDEEGETAPGQGEAAGEA